MAGQVGRRGLRILVVEDESMISLLIEELLEELGHTPIGPAATIDEALAKASEADVDAAILDVNLNGARTYSVADKLRARKIPFIFATGYGARALSRELADVPALQKPFDSLQLMRALNSILPI